MMYLQIINHQTHTIKTTKRARTQANMNVNFKKYRQVLDIQELEVLPLSARDYNVPMNEIFKEIIEFLE